MKVQYHFFLELVVVVSHFFIFLSLLSEPITKKMLDHFRGVKL